MWKSVVLAGAPECWHLQQAGPAAGHLGWLAGWLLVDGRPKIATTAKVTSRAWNLMIECSLRPLDIVVMSK